MTVSGFTFVHNGIAGGYPFVEAIRSVQPFVSEVVAVDMASTDGTRDVLERLGCRVLDGAWTPGSGDACLVEAWRMNERCQGEFVLMFEADEVWDPALATWAVALVEHGLRNLAVWRLQLEHNFQRCRWYPRPVHRVFPRGQGSYLHNPVEYPAGEVHAIPPECGFLWDCCNCFRDNWKQRLAQQAELWARPRTLSVPQHFLEPVEIGAAELDKRLAEPDWEWKATPFAVPDILKPLVGMTKYDPRL